MNRILLLALFAGAIASRAVALPPQPLVEYVFSGTVSRVFDGPFFGITPQVGDPISGHFSYDRTTFDYEPDSTVGNYQVLPPSVFEMDLNGIHISSEGNFFIGIQNSVGGTDVFQMGDGYATTGAGTTLLVNGTSQPGNIFFDLADVTNSSWSTDALPPVLDFSKFRDHEGSVQGDGGANFTITSLFAVPEPSAAALLFVGAVLFAVRRSHEL